MEDKGIVIMSNSAAEVTPLGFTKLIVEDVDRMSEYYRLVCGLEEEARSEDRIAGRPIIEVYFQSNPPGTGTFTLTKFLDTPRIANEAVILGFVTTDIEQFVANAVSAGSRVIEPVQSRPDHGVQVAFVKDIEGNLIEVVQIL